MSFIKLTAAAVAALAVTSSSAVLAGTDAIKPLAKSTQALVVPPVPPWITAIYGPNASLVVGAVGVPGVVVGSVVIAGIVYVVVVDSDSSTTTTTD